MKLFLPAICLPGLFFWPASLGAQASDGAYPEALLASIKSGSSPKSGNWDARLKKISGDVRVRASHSAKWEVQKGEMPLSAPYSIKTEDSVAEIYLDDRGIISVGRNTELEVYALNRSESVFNLRFGNVTAKLMNFTEDKLKMQIRTPYAVCSVRGTEFSVEYSYLLKNTGVAVFDEGSVAVSVLGPKGETLDEYLLKKNTELSFMPGQKRFKPGPLERMIRYKTQVIGMRKTLTGLGSARKKGGGASGKEYSAETPATDSARAEMELAPGTVKKHKRPVRVKSSSRK